MKLYILLAAIAAAACTQAEHVELDAYEHVGVASIIDGDTLDIRENRYRFNGIDTPERGSRCGSVNVYQKAAFALSDITKGRNVTCEPNGTKTYDRLVATCFVDIDDKRVNLSQHLVEEGWARDWPRYSKGKYAGAERAARSKKLGVWGLTCPNDLWGDRNYD